MLDFIKNIMRRKAIRELMAEPRDKRINNIEQVRSIGVICHLDNEQNWNVLYHFAKYMENQGKSIRLIALQDTDINFVVTHKDTTLCNAKEGFSFWGIPRWEAIRPFCQHSYDLLIDTIGEENFFSQYIALHTKASLKVVYATPAEDPSEIFDLIIRGDGHVELKGFFNNIIEYLGMIKK